MTAKAWPTMPRTVQGLAGPIRVTVRRVKTFKSEDGDDCWGLYRPLKRQIIIAGQVPPALRWHTLIHEWGHAWLIDSGVANLLHGAGPELERNVELVCDSLATAVIRAFVRQTGIDPFKG